MVESTQDKNKQQNEIIYAKYRDDKQPDPGHSRELICIRTPKEHYDDLDPIPDEGLDTILKVFRRTVSKQKDMEFVGTRDQNQSKKPYTWKTWGEIDELVTKLGRGMQKMNLCPLTAGEDETQANWRFVGIHSRNRYEWMSTQLAGMMFKVTTVGFYDSLGQDAVAFIINQTEMATIFCSKESVQKLIDLKKTGNIPTLKNIVCYDDFEDKNHSDAKDCDLQLYSFDHVVKEGQDAPEEKLEESAANDVYMLSYTSGTTGDSKGVKLTHKNILSTVRSGLKVINDLVPEDIIFSYLPYAHSFEQSLLIFSLLSGMKIGYYQNVQTVLEDVKELAPTFFPSVPRIWNRIYGGIMKNINAAGCCKRAIANKAIRVKTQNFDRDCTYTHGTYDKVFKKARALTGGRVRYMITASAPIDLKVLNFLKIAFSAPVLEGYGLTESSGAAAVTSQNDPKGGHVGGPVDCCAIRLKDVEEMNYSHKDQPYPRGEICLRGPGIFSGYYKRPDVTADCFDQYGWFKTGDVGVIFPNGSVKIIDRAKNIFKLAQGEYIAPEKLENIYVLSKYIGQIFVTGDSLKTCPVAIVAVDEAEVQNWAKSNDCASVDQAVQDARLNKAILDDINELARQNKFSSLEKPKRIHLVKEPFSIEQGILTPTFKMKRKPARDYFQKQIDEMYADIEKEMAQNNRV